MSRLLPRSLFGRLVLALVGALLLAQLASALLMLYDRGRLAHGPLGWRLAVRQVPALVRLLDDLPPARREAIARAFSAPPLVLRLLPRPLPPAATPAGRPGGASGAGLAMMAAMLGHRLGDGRPVRIEALGRAGPGAGRRPRPRAEMPGMHAMMMGMPWEGPRVYRVQVRLADGAWAVFEQFTPEELTAWPLKLLGGIAVLLVSVVAVSLWVVRRLTRPLAMLAGAAEVLGRDLKAPPLPEDGPTEVAHAARAFNTMQRRLVRLVDDRTRILAAVSHDLKTPLTRMRLRAEMLDDDTARERFAADLDEMQQMVQSALDFARGLDDAEESRPVDVNALCASVAEDLPGGADRVRVEDAAAAPYPGRPLALKRCVSNLVANALRYTESEVTIEIDDAPSTLTLRVLDRGPGIPEAELERVTEPYYRLERSRSRESGGAGLGLSIALAVARAHGGDLVLRNRERGGLEARVVLPR